MFYDEKSRNLAQQFEIYLIFRPRSCVSRPNVQFRSIIHSNDIHITPKS